MNNPNSKSSDGDLARSALKRRLTYCGRKHGGSLYCSDGGIRQRWISDNGKWQVEVYMIDIDVVKAVIRKGEFHTYWVHRHRPPHGFSGWDVMVPPKYVQRAVHYLLSIPKS